MPETTPKPEQVVANPDSLRESLIDCVNFEERKALRELANPNLGLSAEQQDLVSALIHDLCKEIHNALEDELTVPAMPENPHTRELEKFKASKVTLMHAGISGPNPNESLFKNNKRN